MIRRNYHETHVYQTTSGRLRREDPEIVGPTYCSDCGESLIDGPDFEPTSGSRAWDNAEAEGRLYRSHARGENALCTGCADADDAEEQDEARRVLLDWQRAEAGRSIEVSDGLVTIEGPGIARAAFPCAGGKLPVGALYAAMGGF